MFCLIVLANSDAARGVNITWIGGDNDWVDGAGNNANWSPADEPDAADAAIFNTANAVNLGSNNAINGLTLSGGIDLSTNGFDLPVEGLVQLTGANTNLFIGGTGSELNAWDLTTDGGGTVELRGGTLSVIDPALVAGLLTIDAGGTLSGHGTINLDASLVAATLLNNNGTLTALSRSGNILIPPPVGTLSINGGNANARINLDGTGETGIVNVNRNQTLDINVALADAFNGTLNMAQNTTLDIAGDWTLGAGGAINVDNGATGGIPSISAGPSTIAGGTLSQSDGTLTVVDSDGALIFDAPFDMTGGTFTNNGHVTFNASSSIAVASFNFDAGDWTVQNNALLTINVTDYDSDAATNSFDRTILLNNGDISVTTGDTEFVMDGALNMHSDVEGQIVSWSGEPLDVGNDAGVLDADLIVTGTRQSQIAAPVDFNSDADVDVANGATLALLSTVNFDTVNGDNNAQFTGAGTIAFSAGVNVNEAVTLNMAGGTVDLDGLDSVGDFVNVDAPLTVQAATLTNFGRVNGGGGTNTLDVNNSVGTGVLTVNLDSAFGEWTLNGPGVMNLVNDNTEATLLAGSDLNINGTLNVTGDVRSTARLEFGSTAVVNINTAGQPLRLAGGIDTDPNRIEGATVSGAGLLGADTGKSLHGFGTINTNIDFDGNASLRADDGTLTINGDIVDAGQVGTADIDGNFHVTNPWNNNVTTGVQLKGGTVSGGMITNDVAAGISGHGTVFARVINNTKLTASIGDSLIFQTPANDNDWDGTTGTGEIEAVSANIEIRDNATFGFTGTVTATNGRTAFANGFALDFNPGSTLALASGGIYHSTSSTDLGGHVDIGPGEGTIEVQNNFFLTFETGSATALGSNLTLKNNNINIEAGATFSSTGGAIVVPDGSHLVIDNNADIDVLLNMQGAFRPGNFEGIGRVELLDYQQADTGELYTEMRGTGLNQFDRLVVGGDAVVDGYLNIDIDEVSPGVPFVPALGQTFNIITAGAVTGQFDYYDISGMPAGLAFHVKYLANAVQLEVVNKEFFAADFDEDGDVDPTDYAIWKNAYNLNQLGDATGDNISNAADYSIWRDQLGSISDGIPGSGSLGLAAVPEPACTLLTGIALAAAACLRVGRTRFDHRRR